MFSIRDHPDWRLCAFRRKMFVFPSLIIVFVLFSFNRPADERELVMFTFFHPATGNQYIHALISEGRIYLPVTSILQMLAIPFEQGTKELSLTGTSHTEGQKWILDPLGKTASLGWVSHTIKNDDFLTGETDLYLLPWLFKSLFGLHFSVNLNTLDINMKSDAPLPAEEKLARQKLRNILMNQHTEKTNYPQMFPRDRKLLGGGIVDYTLTGFSDGLHSFQYSYFFSGGMEILGGDFQGSSMGMIAEDGARPYFHGLRWRYVPAENAILRAVQAGQLSTTGLRPGKITGISITNEPVIPRQSWDFLTEHGYTEPDSEVELYVNRSIVAYAKADEMGHYQLDFPLNYGTSLVQLRIYTPNGAIVQEEKYISVPYNFLPKGELSYVFEGGVSDFQSFVGPRYRQNPEFHASMAYGITKDVTFRSRLEGGPESTSGTFGSMGISLRLFRKYLVNAETVPGDLYRIQGSVIWPENRSAAILFTRSDMKNPGILRGDELRFDLSIPFQFRKHMSGIRLHGDYLNVFRQNIQAGWIADLNTSFRNYFIRLHFRSRFQYSLIQKESWNHTLTGTLTRNFSGNSGQFPLIRGLNMRIQSEFDLSKKRISETGIQLSRSIWPKKGHNLSTTEKNHHVLLRNGRFYLQFAGNPSFKTFRAEAGISLDLGAFSTSAQVTSSGRKTSGQHQLSGSLAYNESKKNIIPSDRYRAGQSGLAVRFFADDNNNAVYDRGEQVIFAPGAFRPENTAIRSQGKDSVIYFDQLQSYRKYNVQINRDAIPNPMLTAAVPGFSLVTDPNRYKRINIPLFRTGVIDGMVTRNKNGDITGVPGVRLFLIHTETSDTTVLRTFSNGSFYAMDLLPGSYLLKVDNIQLNYLNIRSEPEEMHITIKPLAEGDFQEGLHFELY